MARLLTIATLDLYAIEFCERTHIHTCNACGVNAFDYLQALQIHVKKVLAQTALWLPWNYREQLGVPKPGADPPA